MSNVKLLNLDELAVIKRVVQINGKEYPVVDQSIEQMLSRLTQIKDTDINSPQVFLENMRQTAQEILPSAPKKVIGALTIKQITRLVEFLNDQELDAAAEQMKEAGDKAGETGQAEPEKKS